MSRTLHFRGKVAALTRDRTPNDPELVAARSELKAAKLEDAVTRAISTAPPLSIEQRDRLVALLRGSGDAA